MIQTAEDANATMARVEAMPLSANDSPGSFVEAYPIFLHHASPRILTTALLAALIGRIAVGGFSLWDVVPVVVIAAVWPVQEWLIHVYILHFKPIEVFGRTIEFPTPRSHRLHHRDPWNYKILFIPLHTYIYSLPMLWLLWTSVTPNLGLALTAISTHLLLALHYEWIHFLIHTRVQPIGRFYQHLWRGHRLHHFKSEHYWYGVTRTEGDWLFHTAPGPKDVPTSATCRELLGQAPA